MDMDKIFEAFINVQTVLICLSVYVMTYTIRKVMEGVFAHIKENRLWREVWLPLGPIFNGGALGFLAKTFVWPTAVNGLVGRIFYGAICGVFSALVYSRIRSWVQSAPAKKGGKLLVPSPTAGTPSIPPMTSDPPGPDDEGEAKVGGVDHDDGK